MTTTPCISDMSTTEKPLQNKALPDITTDNDGYALSEPADLVRHVRRSVPP